MPRHPRLHVPGGFYHIILRGNGRQAIFFDREDRLRWQSLIEMALVRYQHRIHAYCWMTNHVHMAVQAGSESLSRFMGLVTSRYARWLNRKIGRQGHLFERRYRAMLVQYDQYLLELVRYIHLNPVRARMVANPIDHRWSSHTAYLEGSGPAWLTVNVVLRMFAADRVLAQNAYAEYVTRQPSDATLRLLRKGINTNQPVIGSDSWAARVLDGVDSCNTDTNLDKLIRDKCAEHGVREDSLASPSRSRRNARIRAEIALAATQLKLATVSEIATRFNRAHSGLSRSMNRLRDQQ